MQIEHCPDCGGIYSSQGFKGHICKGKSSSVTSYWDTKDYPEIRDITDTVRITYFGDFCVASIEHKVSRRSHAARGDTAQEAIINAMKKFNDEVKA